jgi:1-phosphatidylinositol-3-phosphate 5-kinase
MVRHEKGGKEWRMDLLIMENLLYGRKVARVYDLKGSLRSRYNADSNKKDAVLLDENMLESFRNFRNMPLFITTKDKRFLQRAVWNDTAFLAVSILTMSFQTQK